MKIDQQRLATLLSFFVEDNALEMAGGGNPSERIGGISGLGRNWRAPVEVRQGLMPELC
jgi:hypothetical protein